MTDDHTLDLGDVPVPRPHSGRSAWVTRFVLLAVALVATAVVVRQVLNALPLSLYIRGVSAYKATINDLGAILMSVVAPPPSDLARRVTMFTSWGVPAAKGVAGTLMNPLTFYSVRFSAPAVGFVLLLATGQPPGMRWLELASIAVAVTIVVTGSAHAGSTDQDANTSRPRVRASR